MPIVFLLFHPATDGQSVEPLITPQIQPFDDDAGDDAPGVDLGFSGAPSGGDEKVGAYDDGFNPLPGGFDGEPFGDDAFRPLEAGDADGFRDDAPDADPPEEWPEFDVDSPSGFGQGDEAGVPHRVAVAASPGIGGGWPSGFADAAGVAPMMGDGIFGPVREGLAIAVTLGGTYDSNPSQGVTTVRNSGQGDFMMSLGGGIRYRSIAPIWTFGFSYSGSYSVYFDQSDLNGYNQDAEASLYYDSGPLSASLALGIDFGSGANRFHASVVDEISYRYRLDARYRYSPKTSITGSFSQRLTDASGGTDTNSFDAAASALWQYSPLTEFGPGIRYTRRGGDSRQSRTTIGPTVTVNYQLSEKVGLSSRVGADFVRSGSGGSADPSLSTSIAVDYRATSYWGMNLTLLRDVQSSFNQTDEFEEITALRLGYNRTIRRASWNVGLGWETRSSENSDRTTATRPDRDYLTADTSVGMSIFADTTNLSVFMRYRNQSGGTNESWDSIQVGFNISRAF